MFWINLPWRGSRARKLAPEMSAEPPVKGMPAISAIVRFRSQTFPVVIKGPT